eukprot:CAMPEP_0174257468 /NCGR_PEP_ID=MMETSP0439-20130205/6599_1 /TAXON_ID=0 /ORGANISM="Stereomyxa ramosa, Strain Chinc5" /LENGTH=433 /DNA_ID=CAMNT_0015340563 /DNA_START=49 /DNA_END=1346 /DNA_ORIENTATION=+
MEGDEEGFGENEEERQEEEEWEECFGQADTPQHVLFREDGSLSAASPHKLIQIFTDQDAIDEDVEVFLMTYPTFLSDHRFLALLKLRMFPPDKEELSETENNKRRDEALPTCLRCCKILQQWVKADGQRCRKNLDKLIDIIELGCACYPEESNTFELLLTHCPQVKSLKEPLLEFVATNNVPLEVDGVCALPEELMASICSLLTDQLLKGKNINTFVIKYFNLPTFDFADFTDLMSKLPPKILAEQLALMQLEDLKKIPTTELLEIDWRKNSPFLWQAVQKHNLIYSFFCTGILFSGSFKKMEQALGYAWQVAESSFKLNDLATTMAMINVFNSSPVHRILKVLPKLGEKIGVLSETFSSTHSYQKLRAHTVTLNPPCTPYIGLYLTDLVFINDGNEDRVGKLVNWKKCKMLSEVIRKIQELIQGSYPFSPIA